MQQQRKTSVLLGFNLLLTLALFLALSQAQTQPSEDPALPFLRSIEALLSDLLPLWQRHIELVRAQSSEAVGGLTQQFIAINEMLTQNMEDGDDQKLFRVIQGAQNELPNAINALDDTRASS